MVAADEVAEATIDTDMTTGFTLEFGPANLVRALNNAVLFASKDRPGISCVRFTVDNERVLLEATDSYAMIRETIDADRSEVGHAQFIVSRDVVAEVAKMVKAARATVSMTYSPVAPDARRVTFECGGRTISCGDDAGGFPNTDRPWNDFALGEVAQIGFAGNDLARLGKVVASSHKVRGETVRFNFATPIKPAVASIGDRIEVLNMPSRI